MIDDILKSVSKDITDNLNNIIDFYKEIMPKIIKRKIRYKGKIKYQYLYRYNPFYELLPSPRMLTIGLRHILKNDNKTIRI